MFREDNVRSKRFKGVNFGVILTPRDAYPLWINYYASMPLCYDSYVSSVISTLKIILSKDDYINLVLNSNTHVDYLRQYVKITTDRVYRDEIAIFTDIYTVGKSADDSDYISKNDIELDDLQHPMQIPILSISSAVIALRGITKSIEYMTSPTAWNEANLRKILSDTGLPIEHMLQSENHVNQRARTID